MSLTQEEKTEQLDAYVAEVELDLPVPAIPVVDKLFCEPFDISIDLPWGVSLATTVGMDFPDCQAWIERLLGPLNSLLGAIQPIFLIVDVLIALQECISAIPEAILSLSPDPILDCIENLVAAVLAVLCAVYPPFAWPAMILSIVDFIIKAVTCVALNIQALCEAIERINNLETLVQGNPDYAGAVPLLEAARTNVGCQVSNSLGVLTSICSLIEVVNSFIDLANDLAGEELMPTIPCPAFTADTPCEEILAIIEEILTVLNAFDAIIPECPPA